MVVKTAVDLSALRATGQGLIKGTLAGLDASGRPLVDYPGNCLGPLPADSVVHIPDDCGRPVLLLFEGHDPTRPIIVGFLRNRTEPQLLREKNRRVVIDARELFIDAYEEITIQCGASSISLRRDGKVIIKGSDIVSRASRTNKVKGATVKIN